MIVGYICYPLAFLLGVPRNGDLLKVGQLLGTKLIANEFVAYTKLQTDPAYADLSPRSRLIATVSRNFGAIVPLFSKNPESQEVIWEQMPHEVVS